ncbi:MAG: uL15 family ribosomal protein [Candidatus Woesearchaeota archaeon]|nr:uL15 family ribosomal protein [Candidatus Woesearchaeota archaeon]
MVTRLRKKNSRQRGSNTHGWGSMKKHRGAGHRGGRGNAGSGKKGDGRKPSVWKKYKGGKDPSKRGFHSRFERSKTINIGHLSSIAATLVKTGKAAEKAGKIIVNLRELGIEKLLGGGRVGSSLSVSVALATPKAKEKIEKAGGSLDADVVDKAAVIAERAAKVAAEKKPKKEEPEKKSEEKSKEKKPKSEEKPPKEEKKEKPEEKPESDK